MLRLNILTIFKH